MNHLKIGQSSQATIHLKMATQNDLFEVKYFLKRHKQSSVQSDDSVFIVRLNTPSSRAIIGVAKLKSLSQHTFWLHGLYITPLHRKQGMATQLLQFLTEQLAAIHSKYSSDVNQIFAFPLAHLERFYLQHHYQLIEPSHLPNELNLRYQNAQKQHKNWLCMALKL
ncbi:hypothetical protein MNBD_GAMMA03-1185 [hydrothermal vent metagenome]|uniref:N-acetyltransferase domain-containing protein n=1 Tax=hydrothermal vent metagenome TaxID=652676 RepID=A0A3B0W0X1_9ZZZZ